MLKFNNKKLNDIDTKYYCPSCSYVYENNAYQIECGCRACFECLHLVRNNGNCNMCGESVSKTYEMLDRALLKELNKQEFVCPECNTFKGNIMSLKEHDSNQHAKTVTCEMCNTIIEINEEHLCPNEQIPCSYSNIGCVVNLQRKDMHKHQEENMKQHLDLLANYVTTHFKTSMEASIDQSIETSSRCVCNDQPEIVLVDYQNSPSRKEIIKSKCAQATVFTCDERINSMDFRSYDGSLIWKIVNVSEKVNDAKKGRQTSFYSPIFYSSRYGYRMCARIYLNGDGMGRNTHLSLFFVILRSEYDALLKWPFQQKVSFVLIDQSDKKQHIIDTFEPDPNSNSFKRPTTDMNIESGIPLYCPLNKVFSTEFKYVKDNIMFIQVIVDTSSLGSNYHIIKFELFMNMRYEYGL